MSQSSYGGGGNPMIPPVTSTGNGSPTGGQYSIPGQTPSQPQAAPGSTAPRPMAPNPNAPSSPTTGTRQAPAPTFGPNVANLFDISNEKLSLSNSQVLESLYFLTPSIDIKTLDIDYNRATERITPRIDFRLAFPINNEFLEDLYFNYLRIRVVRVSDSLFGDPATVDWTNNYEDILKNNPVLSALDFDNATKLGGQFIFADANGKNVNEEFIPIAKGIRSQTLGDFSYFYVRGRDYPKLIENITAYEPNHLYYIVHTYLDIRQLLIDNKINPNNTNLPISLDQHGKVLIINGKTGFITRYAYIVEDSSSGEWRYAMQAEVPDDDFNWQGPVNGPLTLLPVNLPKFLATIPSDYYTGYDKNYVGLSPDLARFESKVGVSFSTMVTEKPKPPPSPLPANAGTTSTGNQNMSGQLPPTSPLPATTPPAAGAMNLSGQLPPPGTAPQPVSAVLGKNANASLNAFAPAPIASPAQILFDVDLYGILRNELGADKIGNLLALVPALIDSFFIQTVRVYRTRIATSGASNQLYPEKLIANKDLVENVEIGNYKAQIKLLNFNTPLENPYVQHMVITDYDLVGDDGDEYQYRVELEIVNTLKTHLDKLKTEINQTNSLFESYSSDLSSRKEGSGIQTLEPSIREDLYLEGSEPWLSISISAINMAVSLGMLSSNQADTAAISVFDMLHPASLSMDRLSFINNSLTKLATDIGDLVDDFGLNTKHGGLKDRFTFSSSLNFAFKNTGIGYSYLPSLTALSSQNELDSFGIQVLDPSSLQDITLSSVLPTAVKFENKDPQIINPQDRHELLQLQILYLTRTGSMLPEKSIDKSRVEALGGVNITLKDLEGNSGNLGSLYNTLNSFSMFDKDNNKKQTSIPENTYLANAAPAGKIQLFLGYKTTENDETLMRSPIFRDITEDDLTNKDPGALLCRIEQVKTDFTGLKLPVVNKYFLLDTPAAFRKFEFVTEFVDQEDLADYNTKKTQNDINAIAQEKNSKLAS